MNIPSQFRQVILDLFKHVLRLCSDEQLGLYGLPEEGNLSGKETVEEMEWFLDDFIIFIVRKVQQDTGESSVSTCLCRELLSLYVVLREGEEVLQTITGYMNEATNKRSVNHYIIIYIITRLSNYSPSVVFTQNLWSLEPQKLF